MSCTAYNPTDLPENKAKGTDLEESSGTHDKNGKEVYQGDIAKSATGIGLVIKTPNGFEFETCHQKDALWKVTSGSGGRKFEVIGNIHENPDLMPTKL